MGISDLQFKYQVRLGAGLADSSALPSGRYRTLRSAIRSTRRENATGSDQDDRVPFSGLDQPCPVAIGDVALFDRIELVTASILRLVMRVIVLVRIRQ